MNGKEIAAVAVVLGTVVAMWYQLDSKIEGRIGTLDTKFDTKFDRIDAKFDRIDAKFDTLSQLLNDNIITMSREIGELNGYAQAHAQAHGPTS